MGQNIAGMLEERLKRVIKLRESAQYDLQRGFILAPIPRSEWSIGFRIIWVLSRIIGYIPAIPKQKRQFSANELGDLGQRNIDLGQIIYEMQGELDKVRKNASYRDIPPGLIEGDSDYPDDWEQISLQYRRKIGFICEDCGAKAPDGHVHHDIPVKKTGGSGEDNLIFLCRDCHRRRHPHLRDC